MTFADVYREFIATAGEVARRKIDRDRASRVLSTILDDTIKLPTLRQCSGERTPGF
jgi:hypothetical protein